VLSSAILRSQAIPMGEYRRRVVFSQIRPFPIILTSVLIIYRLAVYLGGLSSPLELALPEPRAYTQLAPRDCAVDAVDCIVRPELTSPEAIPQPPPPPPSGIGSAPLRGIGGASLANIKMAVALVDGTVIEPGEKFSFDDTARTWDYKEDPRYLMGPATSARGIIYMRGGGVCWLSTAIWNAALEAGLPTEFRENHMGLVSLLGAGLDATNTLVIRNDSTEPVTVRAWVDGTHVLAMLQTARPLDRTATVEGPYARGGGRYVTYQNVAWADGTETTNTFTSAYYW